jgi:tRNA-2-methylthio-N6-dimethylallyladenosine synthase
VPYTRGGQVSRPATAIIDEAKALIDAGAKELTLLGQNVNAWTADGMDFSALVRRVAALPGLARMRYTTSHPRDMTQALIDMHADVPQLMPYLHLPVQTGSDALLKAMNRKHRSDEYLRLVDRVRMVRPDIAVSGDFIVGFPGETDEDFAATLRLVATVRYAQAFSFKYSPRLGTPAAERTDQVPEAVKEARLAALQAELGATQLAFNAASIGRSCEVLLERAGKLPGQFLGKSPWLQSGHVIGDFRIGDLVRVRLANATQTSLEGRDAERIS